MSENAPLSLKVLHWVWKYCIMSGSIQTADQCFTQLLVVQTSAELFCAVWLVRGLRAHQDPQGSNQSKHWTIFTHSWTTEHLRHSDGPQSDTPCVEVLVCVLCWSTGPCLVLNYWSMCCVEILVHVLKYWSVCYVVLCCVLPADGRCENSSVVWLVWSQWILVTTQPSDQSQSTKQLSWGLDHKELSEALICSQLSHTNRGCSHDSPVDWTSSWSDWT